MKSYKHPSLKCEHGVFNIDSFKVKLRTTARSTQDKHMEFSLNDWFHHPNLVFIIDCGKASRAGNINVHFYI